MDDLKAVLPTQGRPASSDRNYRVVRSNTKTKLRRMWCDSQRSGENRPAGAGDGGGGDTGKLQDRRVPDLVREDHSIAVAVDTLEMAPGAGQGTVRPAITTLRPGVFE